MNHRRIITNAVANWIGFAAQLVVAFFMSPILVHGLGAPRYGIWSLVESILAYLMLFDLGVAASVVRYIARFEANGDQDRLNRIFSTSLCIFAGAGLAVAAVTVGLASLGATLVKVPAELVHEARWMLVLLGFNLSLGLPLNVFPSLLDGLARYPAKTAIRTAGLIARTGLFLIVIWQKGGLIPLAWSITACNIVEHVILAATCWWYLPRLRFSPALVDRETFRLIRGYSLQAFLLMIAGRVSYQTNALVIGAFLAPQYITYFAVAARLIEYAKNALRAVTTVLTPAVSAFEARGDLPAIRSVFLTSTRFVLWVILPIQAGFYLLGKPFLSLWMGPEYVGWSYPSLAILALPLFLILSQSVSGRVLYGVGRLRWFTVVVTGEAIANLVISLALVGPLGIEGVAWGTTIPNILGNIVVAVHVCGLLNVRLIEYVRCSFLRPIAVTCLLSIGWWAVPAFLDPGRNWPSLLLVGGIGVAAYGAVALMMEFGPVTLLRFSQACLQKLGNLRSPFRQANQLAECQKSATV
ncbi:MAG TPA: polysaccharide biosynthesis C-terminal domain-containing protein [Gemmataceae bacterium]|jgi:O-antigen/teichoic acid export membrane protein|nr:polysaccharide biosynthesis C-terminal domain-containing protein [Gemmataceae bacterium]